jgi:hypothetical protein
LQHQGGSPCNLCIISAWMSQAEDQLVHAAVKAVLTVYEIDNADGLHFIAIEYPSVETISGCLRGPEEVDYEDHNTTIEPQTTKAS